MDEGASPEKGARAAGLTRPQRERAFGGRQDGRHAPGASSNVASISTVIRFGSEPTPNDERA